MKNFAILLIVTALVVTQAAKVLQRWQIVTRQQQIDFAVQRATQAKATFAQQYADTENALAGYNEATPEERAETLIDLGLLTDKNAMCLADCGALDEQPQGRTPAQVDALAHQDRIQAGRVALAMR